ncbi:MAG TPA: ABC-type transport auxiliary lipoprotein family protein [Xanthobacteraceae bacterium]|jgi:phospholipid/cholesterol/gamma-HCH transport system substrate-binding protein|nr:ABC-type transport auxiliary lipoprotein family protein [Xanthobacteraceae bacterium]
METRAPYALIGLFVLAVIGGAFGFVYWLQNTGGLGERAVYRVRFESTVSGLLTGAAVLFNGIRVGEVTGLGLDAHNPRQVMATITVAADTPVRVDTQAGLEFEGLTGVPVIALRGGAPEAARLARADGEAPTLRADPAAGESMTDAARQALRRIDAVLADNSDALKSSIANLNTFTNALARNSDRVDTIISGLERMVAGTPAKPPPAFYDITAPRAFPASAAPAKVQLVIPEPNALLAFDTPRIIFAPGAGDGPPVEVAQWRDNIPKLIQAKLIESFENANYLSAVARPIEGLAADYQLLIDVRDFEISPAKKGADSATVAHVGFAAKILGGDGKIVASRTFDAAAPVRDTGTGGAVAALNDAFRAAATDLVVWAHGAV